MPASQSISPGLFRVLIVMGVSGSGKTVVGQEIARQIGARFCDADHFHPPENIAKMSALIPLSEEDRRPWLEKLKRDVVDATPEGSFCVLACSALRRYHREFLRGGREDVVFVHLQGDFALIASRIAARRGHYMKRELLESQFAALETPAADEAVTVPVAGSVEEIATLALEKLRLARMERR